MEYRFMIVRLILPLLVLIGINSGCERIKNKTKTIANKATTKGKELVDTLLSKTFPYHSPDSFSVRSIVKDFKGDSSIKEIKGIQTEVYFLYVDYCKYVGKKDRVIKGVNKIQALKKNDYKSDKSCYLSNATEFYSNVINEERDQFTQFFWDFEKLKSYEIYCCIKAPFRHLIIFDKHSDTVYHWIEELAD